RRRVVFETEFAGDALSERFRLQKAVLSLVELLVRDAGVALDAVDVHHLVGVARDLEPGRRCIFARHECRDENSAERTQRHSAEQHPPPARGGPDQAADRGNAFRARRAGNHRDLPRGKGEHMRRDRVHQWILSSPMTSGVVSSGSIWTNCWNRRFDLESPTITMSLA